MTSLMKGQDKSIKTSILNRKYFNIGNPIHIFALLDAYASRKRKIKHLIGQGILMIKKDNEKLSGSYALVTVHDREQRVEVMRSLANIEQVISSHAVDGDYDIVLLIRELPGAGIDKFVSNKIRTLMGVNTVEICHVELTVNGGTSASESEGSIKTANSYAESYLFLETDKRHFEDIFSSLSVLSSVTSCEVASGQYSLVLRLKAGSFDTLTRIINDKIRPLPGVLRARESRIIKLASF